MNYTESIDFLYSLQKFGMKFGLEGIQHLLDFLGNPEKKFRSIHIAGTNGKGSTASMIAAIFAAAGYKTGLYTSPHLVSFNERIRIDGKPIASRDVVKLLSKINSKIRTNNNTFFEAVTAIAFKYFADSSVDIAIVETGLGGRLDATNVLNPMLSIITTIGLEHTQILGGSLEKIAFEKGGIIKSGVPCLAGNLPPAAMKVIRQICRERDSDFSRIRQDDAEILNSSLNGLKMNFKIRESKINNVRVSLPGNYQIANALLALNAIHLISRSGLFRVGTKAIRSGLGNVQRYSGIQARLSVIMRNPLLIADVAHNAEAIAKLCYSLRRLDIPRINVLFGLMKDKAYKEIVSLLHRNTKCAYIVRASTDRSRDADELAKEFKLHNIPAFSFNSVASGLASVLKLRDDAPVLITGSHFVVGEAMAYLKKEKYLTINQ